MSVLAIFGCWQGHSTPIEVQDRDAALVMKETECKECGETAFLFDVMTVKPKWRVVLGGNSEA